MGGRGTPLVFLHGAGLGYVPYRRALSLLPQLGFLVVAVDAPGHGRSDGPREAGTDFSMRAALVGRILDELGVERAVLVGHSMGGRKVIELSAARPERTLCAVLLDAAAGGPLDARAARSLTHPPDLARQIGAAMWDTVHFRTGLDRGERAAYRAVLRASVLQALRRPSSVTAPIGLTMRAAPSVPLLRRMREAGVPAVVVHGERDLLVPLESAVDQARQSGAPLYVLPGAFHSWVMSMPRRLLAVMTALLEQELGGALAASGVHPRGRTAAELEDACLAKDARLLDLVPPIEVVDTSAPPGPAVARMVRHQGPRSGTSDAAPGESIAR